MYEVNYLDDAAAVLEAAVQAKYGLSDEEMDELRRMFEEEHYGHVLKGKRVLTPKRRYSLCCTQKKDTAVMTVNEVSKRTGMSISTLQYYDRIGLLPASGRTAAGDRLYGDEALEKLQLILMFRALEFTIKEIMEILRSPDYDYDKVLGQQITLLEMRKEHMENLINFARNVKEIGVRTLDFTVFDTAKIDEYTKQAKKEWGNTPAYREFEEKEQNRTPEEKQAVMAGMISIFAEFGSIRNQSPDSPEAQEQVKRLQDYISKHMYRCTNEILYSLGKMYGEGGEFTKNIDSYGGKGTAEFAAKAIEAYCRC